MNFDDLGRVFTKCLRDAEVFDRDVPGGSLCELDRVKIDNRTWLAVAAGLSHEDARTVFPGNPARAERATTPLQVSGGGQASLLFLVSPCNFPIEKPDILAHVAPFAPGERIPLIEIREAFFRLSYLPDNDHHLSHFRWEFDLATSLKEPMETWLAPWRDCIHCNPAHAPSHAHFNAPPVDEDAAGRDRQVSDSSELRLAVGIPNPLALILSLARWIRQM